MSRAINYIIEHRCEICETIREFTSFSFYMLAPIALPFAIMWLAMNTY